MRSALFIASILATLTSTACARVSPSTIVRCQLTRKPAAEKRVPGIDLSLGVSGSISAGAKSSAGPSASKSASASSSSSTAVSTNGCSSTSGDAPYSLSCSELESVVTFPNGFRNRPGGIVFLVHGTGSTADESWGSGPYNTILPNKG
jgi:hypothetical protein